jgi:hypothetical protein
MKNYSWCGVAGFLVSLGAVHSAHASDFFVTDTSDSYEQGDGVCSLREAVDTANWDDCWQDCGCGEDELDTVSLSLQATYTLDGPLHIWDAMVLWGNQAVVRGADGAGDFAGLVVQTDRYVEFQNLTIENFHRPALLIDQNAALYAWGLEVRNNDFSIGSGQNAAIAVLGGAYLYLMGANIHHNVDNIKGGGIFLNPGASVDLEWSSIHHNQVTQYGGGVHNQGYFHCYGGSIIYSNSAVYGGGGVYNTSAGVFDGPSNECHVISNTSTMGGANIGGHP